MLAIDVEYLAGVAFAAQFSDRGAAEWPPQPDRLFSALVAAWGCGRQDAAERQALVWLELLPPPLVLASAAERRQVAIVYVPPNDARVTGKVGAAATNLRDQLSILPERRRRQARQFPAALPERPTVVFAWPAADAPEEVLAALNRLAARTAYLGHSASLVRVAVRADGEIDAAAAYRPHPRGKQMLRWVYPGRLAELVAGYERGQGVGAWRPRPGAAFAYLPPGEPESAPPPESVFGEQWLVLEDVGGTAPLLTAFPVVAKTLHRALVDCCARLDRPVPELLTGKTADGGPAQTAHLAIVPLADVGWGYSGGRLFGVALVLPRTFERRLADPQVEAVADAVQAFLSQRDSQDETEEPYGVLTLGQLGEWKLGRTTGVPRASLRPGRYVSAARVWATVTPLVLDRFPKDRPGETAEDLVRRACANVRLPTPTAVAFHKYSAHNGAPPAAPPGGNPRWTDWTFPAGSPLAERVRRHVVLEFATEVGGPLLLGAGRYQGLGLCLPLEETHARSDA